MNGRKKSAKDFIAKASRAGSFNEVATAERKVAPFKAETPVQRKGEAPVAVTN